jgi:hypothetical protein
MKLYAYIEPRDFKAYLAEQNTVETEESRSSFLRDVGTVGILFDRVKVGYVEVSSGSCVRVRPETSSASVPLSVPISSSLSANFQPLFSRLWNMCK